MFTWIPIYEEAAKRLVAYEDRNRELVDLIAQMKARGLKTTKIADQGPDDSTFDLKEIDPFTFLANFNRGTTVANRRELWAVLKEEWKLASGLPDDFHGIPNANAQNSWFMPYAKLRSPEHVPLLWKFFRHIMAAEPTDLDTNLMNQCLRLPNVGMAMLTMGMFWACPRRWIATDGKNLAFAENKGLSAKVKNARDYVEWLPKIRAAIDGDAIEFSHQAHLWATHPTGGYGSPFDKLFPDRQPDPVLDYFARVIGVLREEAENPHELLAISLRKRSGRMLQIRLNIWMWPAAAIMAKPSQRLIEFLLPSDHPETVRYREQARGEGQEVPEGFAELVEGVRYSLCYLEEAEFFDRLDELWPAMEKALRHGQGL